MKIFFLFKQIFIKIIQDLLLRLYIIKISIKFFKKK